MKVAVIVNDLCICGGTHKQVLRLCQYLKRQGINFVLYTKYYEKDKTYPEFNQFKIISLKEKPTIFTIGNGYLDKFKRAKQKKQEDRALFDLIPKDIDVYNFHDNGMLWMMKWAKVERNAKVVWQSNDLPLCYRVWINDGIKNRISRSFYQPIIDKIDLITVNVGKNRDRVVSLMNKDAKVFYCGVDVNNKLEPHKYHKIDELKILTVGVFFPRRNYEKLVEVVEQLKNNGRKVHLDIIGSTNSDEKYAKLIKNFITEKNLDNEITIHGQVDEKEYNRLFNEADIFTFINVNQSWGLAVFEAMSCGLPTIVSNSVGAIEILKDGVDSIIVDPMNIEEIRRVIERLINEEDYYNSIALNAMNNVKEYTWENMYCSKMLMEFNKLCGDKE